MKNLPLALSLMLLFTATAPAFSAQAPSAEVQNEVKNAIDTSSVIDYESLLNKLKASSARMLKEAKATSTKRPGSKEPGFITKYMSLVMPRDSFRQAEYVISLMSGTREMLSQSPLVGLSLLIGKKEADIKVLVAQNDKISEEKAAAKSKEEAGYWTSFLGNTKEALTEKQQKIQLAIAQKRADIDYVRGEIKNLLRRGEYSDLRLSDKEVDQVFSAVTGDQDLQVIAIFHNTKMVVDTIAKRLSNPEGTSVDLARDYYGMFTLMIASTVEIQHAQIKKIKEVYLPRLAQLKKNAKTVIANARELQKDSRANNAELENNIKKNEQVIAAIELYEKFLGKKIEGINAGLDNRTQKFHEALNRFMTIDNAGRAIDVMKIGLADLNTFEGINLTVPEMLGTMSDETISAELAKITLAVKAPN